MIALIASSLLAILNLGSCTKLLFLNTLATGPQGAMLVRKKAGGEHGLALLDGLLDIHGTQQAVLHDVQWDLQARHKSQLAVLSQTTNPCRTCTN